MSQIGLLTVALNQISCGAALLDGHVNGATESLFGFASPINVALSKVFALADFFFSELTFTIF